MRVVGIVVGMSCGASPVDALDGGDGVNRLELLEPDDADDRAAPTGGAPMRGTPGGSTGV